MRVGVRLVLAALWASGAVCWAAPSGPGDLNLPTDLQASRQHSLHHRQARMIYLDDVRHDRIWLILQRDVNWPDSYAFEVKAKDTDNKVIWIVQRRITWGQLVKDKDHVVPDGQLGGAEGAVEVMGFQRAALKPDHEYEVTETVWESVNPKAEAIFIKTKKYRTKSVNQVSHDDISDSDCQTMFVCRKGSGNTWFDPNA